MLLLLVSRQDVKSRSTGRHRLIPRAFRLTTSDMDKGTCMYHMASITPYQLRSFAYIDRDVCTCDIPMTYIHSHISRDGRISAALHGA